MGTTYTTACTAQTTFDESCFSGTTAATTAATNARVCVTNSQGRCQGTACTDAGRRCTGLYAGSYTAHSGSHCQGTSYGGHGWCGTNLPGSSGNDWGGCAAVCDSVPGYNN